MKKTFFRDSWILFGLLLLTLVISTAFWAGCTKTDEANGPTNSQSSGLLDKDNRQVQVVMEIQDRHTPEFFEYPDVVGSATGLNASGQLAIMVYLKSDENTPKEHYIHGDDIPDVIEGIPVVKVVTGELVIRDGGPQHRTKQTPPIQLGTSGGWRYDLANGYCCGGTLGSLVQKGGVQYILSNYHVLMADIVSGGNGRIATAGDPVIQPGLIDVNCSATSAQNVGTLEGTRSLPSSNVDAALARVTSGMVRTDGSILDIGVLSISTVGASLNQAVKKSGRTTGLARSTISGLNGTVQITYENECAGGTAFTKTFTGQIIIKNNRCTFLNGGDSGSLMVEDITTRPRAVGLLFAGSTVCGKNAIAIANPIGSVLTFFGATMVGQ